MGDIFDQASGQSPQGDIFDQAAAPQPGFMDRLNKRVAANFEPLQRPQKFLTDTLQEGMRRWQQPYVPGSGLKEIYQGLKQTYSDPANIAGDVTTGYILGQGGGGDEAPGGAEERAPQASSEPSPTPGRAERVGRVLARKIPGVSLAEQLAKAWQGPEPPAPLTPKPPTSYTGPTGPPGEWGRPPLDPAITSPARTLPGQISPEVTGRPTMQGAPPIPARRGLMLPGEAAERRASQSPYSGPNRRVAPEMRGFESAPPIDPERLGIDYRPAEDLGIKVREGTEAKMGPIKRAPKAAKPLQQAESLRMRPTLIEQMGGRPPEEITEPPRSNWPPEAPNVPRQATRSRADLLEDKSLAEQVRESAESEDRQRMSQERRAWFGRNAPAETKGSLVEKMRGNLPQKPPPADLLPGDPGYQWKMRRK